MTYADDEARDELLLQSLMDLVPNSQAMALVLSVFDKDDGNGLPEVAAMLKGYGTLLNVIQAATELEGPLYDRLATGYYELTNKDPGAETDEIRLRDPDNDQ